MLLAALCKAPLIVHIRVYSKSQADEITSKILRSVDQSLYSGKAEVQLVCTGIIVLVVKMLKCIDTTSIQKFSFH